MIDEVKYDRQLRLWAINGQRKLEDSNICLLNSSTVGCEILKNLILPNIGSFTIIDDKIVQENDLSSNFYLELESVGKSKAECCSKMLNELNTTVGHECIIKSVDQIIENKGDEFWRSFDLIICTELRRINSFEKLVCSIKGKVPMLICDTLGFYGILKIMTTDRTIMESHITEVPDLRLNDPWEELSNYVNGLKVEEMPPNQLKDVPYAVILIYLRKKFVEENQKEPNRKEFKQYVLTHEIVKSVRFMNLENIEESIRFSWRATISSATYQNLVEVLQESNKKDLSHPFWNLVESVKRFLETHDSKLLPLSGKIVDMASSTERYIELQQIYKLKANKDLMKIMQHSRNISEKIGSNPVEYDYIVMFCKNVTRLLYQQGSYSLMSSQFSDSLKKNHNDIKEEYLIYVFYLSINEFCRANKRFPIYSSSADAANILRIAEAHGHFATTGDPIKDAHLNILKEIIRNNGMELCNTAAFMGGLAGQEALKLLTNQYVPLNNTLLFDGIKSAIHKWFI